MLDVAADAETDADTDSRYAGAITVSAVGVPSVTLVHPTIAIKIAATQPIARAQACGRREADIGLPDTGCPPGRHPISTTCDVTGSRLRPASTGTTQAIDSAAR
jgi:hypothetical protein